jgi:hypothetical protein
MLMSHGDQLMENVHVQGPTMSAIFAHRGEKQKKMYF